MRFGDGVIDAASIASAGEKLTALHESKMFGGHVAWNFAGFGQFADGVATAEEHLDHSQAVRMGERF
jgi:hypothetical protein